MMVSPQESKGKVLITGAAGFIGYEVTKVAVARGFEVVALDGLLGGLYPADEKKNRWEELRKLPRVELIEDDLRSIEWSSCDFSFDYVINLAAMPGLALSWGEYELYRSCNLDAVARLIDAAASWPLRRFIQISTSSVYGKNAVGDESQPTEPVSPYGVTKLAAETLLKAHYRSFGFPVSILRYFSVYGPGQRPDMAYRKFIEATLKGEKIRVFGDGTQARSNTYVTDVAEVTVNALQLAEAGEVYNICGDEEIKLIDAIRLIQRHSGSDSSIVFHDRVPGDQDRTSGDNRAARQNLGFNPSTPLSEGIRAEIDHLRALSLGAA